MTDKALPEHFRSRSRDRSDQRRPTFQVLNAMQQPKTHSHGKRDHILSHYIAAAAAADHSSHPHPVPGEQQNRDSIESTYSADTNDNETHYPQGKVIGVHTVGKESCASVVSSYRGPACNFTAFFHQSNNNANNGTNPARNRTQSMSPGEVKSSSGRYRSKSPQDIMIVEEPSDLMVWNATKKSSRSNITLTESEFRNMNALDQIKGTHKKAAKQRSSSVPVHKSQQNTNNVNTSAIPGLEDKESIVFGQEGAERMNERINERVNENMNERVDECVPSMSPIEVSPSISIASTSYSMQISLVAQQLEEIQQAQNDVLKHLGEEITKVTGENERLRQEVDHVRDQNEGLLKVVHDTTDELERMKQIFRIRGMPHQQQQLQPQEFNQHQHGHGTVEIPQSLQQQQRHRSHKHQHSQGETRDRESINSNSSNKSNSSKKSARGEGDPVMMSQGAVNSPYLKQSDGLSTKPPKAKKTERKNRQSDDELATLDDQEAAGMADDPTDDNTSHRSNDSQMKSSKRRSREHGHHHHSQSPRHSRHDNNNNSGSESHRRSRSRSKEGHRGSGSGGGGGDKMRTSNCGDEQIDKKRHLNKQIYQDDCNDSIEMRQAEGGCLRVFTCCWSSPTIRSRTDDYSVDDIVLREYRE